MCSTTASTDTNVPVRSDTCRLDLVLGNSTERSDVKKHIDTAKRGREEKNAAEGSSPVAEYLAEVSTAPKLMMVRVAW